MSTGPLALYDSALLALMRQEHGALDQEPLTALLLNSFYAPDMAAHSALSDVMAFEITGGDYERLPLTGASIQAVPGGAAFTTDPLHWGDPVTLPPAGFLVLCRGAKGMLSLDSPLLGVMPLTETAVPVEAVRSAFTVVPPVPGWFTLSRGV